MFVFIVVHIYKKGQEEEGFAGENKKYWFGEKSCIYLLGLVRLMENTITDYIRDANIEYEENHDNEL